jgi:hypothetical protein
MVPELNECRCRWFTNIDPLTCSARGKADDLGEKLIFPRGLKLNKFLALSSLWRIYEE